MSQFALETCAWLAKNKNEIEDNFTVVKRKNRENELQKYST